MYGDTGRPLLRNLSLFVSVKGSLVSRNDFQRGRVALAFVTLFIFPVFALSPRHVAAELLTLAPAAIENGYLQYAYYGNGNFDFSYTPNSTQDLKATCSRGSVGSHATSSYRIFAVDFDLSGFAPGSVVKNATLQVSETIATRTGQIDLYATSETIELSTFNATPFSQRTVSIHAAAPVSFDLTAIMQDAIDHGASELKIVAQNSGGSLPFGGFGAWTSSVLTWSDPQLSINVVPEPSTWAMLLCGAAVIVAGVIRKKSTQSPIRRRVFSGSASA